MSAALLVGAAPAALGGGASVEDVPAKEGVVEDTIIVGFEDDVPDDAEAWIEAMGGQVELVDDATAWVSAQFPDAETADDALDRAQERNDVRFAEHDGYVHVLGVPDDPDYDKQWGYPAIDASAAWDTTTGSHDATVAVLDTGIDTDHEDLQANMCGPFESFVSSEPTVEDRNGHGTHVSGTVAATSDNGVGVAGTSQSCLMHGKVLSGGGFGQWSSVAAGITWATDNGADVISMSLGGGGPPAVVDAAVEYAYYENQVLVVSAAGNAGCGGDTVGYPAKFPESMAVAALASPGDDTAGFSSCGPDVDIAAPGAGVYSTLPGCSGAWLCSNTGYGYLSGTSMATPHVAGVAGLIKAVNPDMNGIQLRCVLYATADDMAGVGRDQQTGFGALNAEQGVTFPPEDPSTIDTEQAIAAAGAGAGCAESLLINDDAPSEDLLNPIPPVSP